jgi:plasmid replication initiation protein
MGNNHRMNEKLLLPNRHPQEDLFICDISDAQIKDDMASMEHPIFSLSTKPDTKIRRYEHGHNWFEITPSVKGLATISDKDILIFAVSQIMAAKNTGQPYSKHVSFTAYDFLVFSNRMTNGQAYQGLKDALTRLRGTTMTTGIRTGGQEVVHGFGLIETFTIRKEKLDGRILEWGITLSDWLFNAIESDEVLTLSPQYFRLRKPLERRLYEVARKHCGGQKMWRINIELLQKKCGSNSPKRNFRAMLKKICEHQHLPDYEVNIETDIVVFTAVTNSMLKKREVTIPPLKTVTYEHFKARYSGYDPYSVEDAWREWARDKAPPKNADAAFLAFSKKHIEQRLF